MYTKISETPDVIFLLAATSGSRTNGTGAEDKEAHLDILFRVSEFLVTPVSGCVTDASVVTATDHHSSLLSITGHANTVSADRELKEIHYIILLSIYSLEY